MRRWINRIRSFSETHYVVTSGEVIRPLALSVTDETQLEWAHEQF